MARARRNRLAIALEALKAHQEAGACFAIRSASVLEKTNIKGEKMRRDSYMTVLEKASVMGDGSDFVRVVVDASSRQ